MLSFSGLRVHGIKISTEIEAVTLLLSTVRQILLAYTHTHTHTGVLKNKVKLDCRCGSVVRSTGISSYITAHKRL